MYKNRPVLKLKFSTFEKVIEIIVIINLILELLLFIRYWPYLPNKVPIHYSLFGNPDSWGSKRTLFLIPLVSILLYFMFSYISRFPHIFNYIPEITEENAERQYRNARTLMTCLKVEVIFLLSFILYKDIYIALRKFKELGIGSIAILLIIIFVTIVYFIIKSIKLR
ncbi:DUF1648 domain-containing protein [Thermoanaerobacterium thermosaccharolyticum]|uniref:DUF1648 domain-containing protein n=1 Tax=Thermoanaerobacterium thermosaccharolyticum M0795 TaxID=698948 RepID=L0IIH2_THETR|nr:Protein of unknown function (DUF1648) [Thermoanaerobacterium thermosaccharolyticum M0795]